MQHALRLTLVAAFVSASACGQAPASQNTAGSGAAGDDMVVATVGERQITLAEVDAKAIQSNMEAYQQLYDARREAVDALVSDLLLAREAESRGVTKDELVAEEITAKVAEVTDADIEQFYNQNRARLGGQSLEQIGPQIRQYLAMRGENLARENFLQGLRDAAHVRVALDPPRVPLQVASNERVKGEGDATVTIIEYSDFQ